MRDAALQARARSHDNHFMRFNRAFRRRWRSEPRVCQERLRPGVLMVAEVLRELPFALRWVASCAGHWCC